MDFSMWFLRYKGGKQLTDLNSIKHLPVGTTTVYLSPFPEISDDDIKSKLSELPSTVWHVSFPLGGLGRKSGIGIKIILSGLPPSVTHVDLSYNDFGSFVKAPELKIGFSGLRDTVTHLDLDNNCFGLMTPEELEESFSELSNSVVNISFRENMVTSQSKERLQHWFLRLPRFIVTIDLSRISLVTVLKPEDEEEKLDNLLSGLPPELKYINLEANGLDKLTGQKLKQLLSGLPINTQYVGLRFSLNEAHDILKVKDWVEGLLSERIHHFDLSRCFMCRRPGEMQQIMEVLALSKNIAFINLSHNELGMHSFIEILQFLRSIPSFMTVNLSFNQLLKNRSEEECKAILATVPVDYCLQKDKFIIWSDYIRSVLALTSLVIRRKLSIEIVCLIAEYLLPNTYNADKVSTDTARYYKMRQHRPIVDNPCFENRNGLFSVNNEHKNSTTSQDRTCSIK